MSFDLPRFPRFVLMLALALFALACGEEGTTPACEDMPVVVGVYGEADAGDTSELEDWRADAAVDDCVTLAGDINDHQPDP